MAKNKKFKKVRKLSFSKRRKVIAIIFVVLFALPAAYLLFRAFASSLDPPLYYLRSNVVKPVNTGINTKCPRSATSTIFGPIADNCVEIPSSGKGRVGTYSPVTKEFAPKTSAISTAGLLHYKNLTCSNIDNAFTGYGPLTVSGQTLYYGNVFLWYGAWLIKPATYNPSNKVCTVSGDWHRITIWSGNIDGSSYPVTGVNRYGLSISGLDFFKSSDSDFNKAMDGVQAAHSKWVRAYISWRVMQPTKGGAIDWTNADRLVDGAESRDLYLLVNIMPNWTPDWANGGKGNNYPATNPSDFGAFVKEVVKHFKERGNTVKHWEIGNEPNFYSKWLPTPSAASYVAQLKAAYGAIKTVDGGSQVIAAPTAEAGGLAISPVTFVTQMYAAGAIDYFDALAFHPYNFPSLAPNGQGWQEMLTIRNIMVSNNDADKKIWATEYGQGTCCETQAAQAAALKAAYSTFSSYSWAGPLFWFTYSDNNSSGGYNFGLVDTNYAHKASWDAFSAGASGK